MTLILKELSTIIMNKFNPLNKFVMDINLESLFLLIKKFLDVATKVTGTSQ